MVKFIKNNYHYFIVFIFVFLVYSVFWYSNNYGDPLYNYGFSYAITRGEIPYVDFNTISTPLYAFVMSIGLFIWNNYLMFLLEQSLLVTIMFYFLNRIYGKKSYILLLTVSITLFLGINATYNFFAFFIMIILMFLEKKYSDKDYLIGIVIGLSVLAKHTVGALLIIPSLIFYFKRKDKLLKRFIGLLGVGIVFILYLLLTNSFMKFFDLCFLGLFDFSSKNGHSFNLIFYMSIVLFIISLIITVKNKKNISNYYLLMGISFVIPLFDLCHFSIYLMCFTLQLLPFIKKNENYYGFLSFLLSWLIAISLGIHLFDLSDPVLYKELDHFEYLFDSKVSHKKDLECYKLFDKYENPLIFSYSNMKYDISRNNDIDYFDVLLYGNFGYDGSNKMIKKIKNMHDKYIIIDKRGYYDEREDSQFDKTIVDYVIKNYTKVDENEDFFIYYKK